MDKQSRALAPKLILDLREQQDFALTFPLPFQRTIYLRNDRVNDICFEAAAYGKTK